MSEPVSKRRRLDVKADHKLFAPFRALGIVSTFIPFAHQLRTTPGSGSKPSLALLTATSSTSWALWTEDSLQLKLVSEPFCLPDEEISCLVMNREYIYAAAGTKIYISERGKVVQIVDSGSARLQQFIVLGNQIIALSESGTEMFVWTTDTFELYTTITMPFGFTATTLLHPATYVNKIVVGSSQGSVAIYNTHTGNLIHTFQAKDILASATKKFSSAVTALEQTPEVDILAIGYASGIVSLFDLRAGEQLITVTLPPTHLTSTKRDAVTSISFRTDNVQHHIAVSTDKGLVAVYDLDSGPDQTLTPGRLVHTIKAHQDAVSRIAYIKGQPLLVSSSGDNSFKQWFFDASTGLRLLRSREGHQQPVSLVRYCSNDGKAILSASQDCLRFTSVVRDARSTALSTNKSTVDLVEALAWNGAKSRDWDDLVTVSRGERVARTWSVQKKRIGSFSFDVESAFKKQKRAQVSTAAAKVVEISACGNFALVGCSGSAKIQMWNMQSGLKRKSFTLPLSPEESGDAHVQVTGIATDSLNRLVVVSTMTGHVHFFDFHASQHIETMQFPAAVTRIVLNRNNNLAAITCADQAVRVIDIETRRVVRELVAFRGQILDIAFSNDGRWLIATSSDSVIRTFDLPTGRLIDAFRTPTTATSLAFSPTGDFLATCQEGSNGIYLWTNRAQFANVMFKSFDKEDDVPSLQLPSVQEHEDGALEELEDDTTNTLAGPSTSEQLQDGLLSLSLLPRSRWQTLLNLDTIRARNKPTEKPKVPERAPFFLPSLTDPKERAGLGALPKATTNDLDSRATIRVEDVESELIRLLIDATKKQDYDQFFDKLINLPPSTLDLEIRSLQPQHLHMFAQALTARLESAKDFEALQAIISVFLSSQQEAILGLIAGDSEDMEDDDIAATTDSLNKLLAAQEKEAARLNGLVGYCLGSLAFIRNRMHV